MTEEVREQLARLRHELDDLAEDQRTARAHLEEIVSEIEKQLDPEQPDPPGLTDRIRRAIETFEVEHPRATSILNQISNKLASMGI